MGLVARPPITASEWRPPWRPAKPWHVKAVWATFDVVVLAALVWKFGFHGPYWPISLWPFFYLWLLAAVGRPNERMPKWELLIRGVVVSIVVVLMVHYYR